MMKKSLVALATVVLLTIPCVWIRGAAADEPVNLAPQAEVWASSQYSDSWAAKYAIDEKIPREGSGSDAGKAWACKGEGSGDRGEFTLQWPRPVQVAEVVYWGRTGSLLSESWKDYELYLDDAVQPAARGSFRMSRKPQRIAIEPKLVRTVRLKFLNSHGALNAGSSEIAVYATRPSKAQLDLFPLAGQKFQEHIALMEKERADMSRVASSLPGKVVFLAGTRPFNELDWQAPMIRPPTATTPIQVRRYMEVEDHTHRCYIEKDTPGPANMGNRMYILDPAKPDIEPQLLVDAGEGWVGCAMSATHDGKTLYFSMAPAGDSFFHIYRVSTSGGEPEQLTWGTFHDVDPDVLPDGGIVFCSTRFGSREEYHSYLVSTLFTMTSEGEDIRAIRNCATIVYRI